MGRTGIPLPYIGPPRRLFLFLYLFFSLLGEKTAVVEESGNTFLPV
jgi:hypothetical protein